MEELETHVELVKGFVTSVVGLTDVMVLSANVMIRFISMEFIFTNPMR